MTHLYVCGPMSGLPEKNFPAFRAAAAKLREAGYEVTDPSTFDDNIGKSWADCLRRDIPAMLQCDGLALLAGWEHSRGARLEFAIASQLDIRAHGIPEWLARYPEVRT